MSAGRDLATRLNFILEHNLSAVQRLNNDDTWIGPTAQSTQGEFNGLHRHLLVLIDEILIIDSQIPL